MALAAQMPVRAVAELVGEHDMVMDDPPQPGVGEAREHQDLSGVSRVGVDETSFRRGQDYVTVFADLDASRAVFATPGRDGATYERFVEDLDAHGGEAGQVKQVCQDMSEAFLSGALEHLPEAEVTFDRYHVKAQLSKAVDLVRRAERREHHDLLKGTRYLWLRRPSSLSDRQRDWLDELLCQPLATAKAYELMLKFDAAYALDRDEAEPYLRAWCRAARDSGLGPIIDFAAMVEEYWLGIFEWFTSKVSNGLLEGLNSLIQAAKRRARGYRSTRNYIAMIYLTVGKLHLGHPREVARSRCRRAGQRPATCSPGSRTATTAPASARPLASRSTGRTEAASSAWHPARVRFPRRGNQGTRAFGCGRSGLRAATPRRQAARDCGRGRLWLAMSAPLLWLCGRAQP